MSRKVLKKPAKYFFLAVMVVLFSIADRCYSQTITSTAAGGNWSSGTTWVGGAVPGPSNSVVIAGGGGTVTLDVNATIVNLTIDNGGSTRSRLQHNTGISLTVTGTVTMVQSTITNVNNGWRIDAGSATVSGLISFNGSNTDATRICTIRITSGVLNANGGISFTTSAAATKVIDMSLAPATGTLNLKGTLIVPSASSTLTAGTSGSTFNYADASAQTINFFSSGAYFNLAINNTSASGASLSALITSTNVTGNITVGNISTGSLFNASGFGITLAASRSLTVAGGSTMDLGTFTTSFAGTGGSVTINGLFRTANQNGFSGSASTAISSTNSPTITLGTASTIEYYGSSTQNVTSRIYNGNLMLTGAIKTIGTASGQTVTVGDHLTINTGATYTGSTNNPVLNIGGDFSNSGTFTQGTGLVTFNGTTVQAILGSSATTFSNSLTLSNAAGLSITTSPQINGTLTFANGMVTTGSNKLILGSAATISGAGAGKYVYGNLEIYIPNSSAPSRTFTIGDAANYTPVLVAFSGTTIGSGSLVVNTTQGDHPNIGTSGINPNLSVNRYWTITQGSTPVGGFTSYSATFTFISGTPVDLDAGANTANFIVNKLTSGTWSSPTTGNRTSTSTQATGMTTFGDYQIGESGGTVVVSTQPQNATVCQGAPASFTSTSNSVPTPTVQWQRDPNTGTFANITAGMDGGVYSNFTTTTLNISNSTGLNNYKYRAVFTNANGSATSNQAVLTVNPLPSAAGTITGSSPVCQGQSGASYSVSAIANATSYTWSFSGSGFTPSGTTASITATYSVTATSGNLTVTGVNSCGNGTPSPAFPVTVNPLPSASGTITGTSPVCQGQSGYPYSIAVIPNATSYQWTYSGTGFTPSGSAASITGGFSASATSGNLTVNGVNSCGNGASSAVFPVTVNTVPAAGGTITGASSVCQGQTGVAYSVPSIPGATSYTWSYSGTGFTPSGNTASITANFSSGATSGNLTVTGVNACGSGIASSGFPITVLNSIPAAAGPITGSSLVCQGQSGVAYSVSPVSGASSYSWNYSGIGFTPSGNTASITGSFSVNATAGNLTVSGVNACGSGPSSAVFPVSVNNLPASAGPITGSAAVCQGQNGVAYSIAPVNGATSYTWIYSGTGFTPSGNTASITANFSTGAASGNLTVVGNNSCGTGAASPGYAITVNPLPGAAGSITGSTLACPGQTGVAYSVAIISGATSYNWTYTGTGFTPSGNTASITASFSAGATSGILTVNGVNACGSGIPSANYPITINTVPSPAGLITGSSTVCPGQTGVAYSVTPIGGATSYSWTYTGTGFTPSGNTASITSNFSVSATSGNLTVRGINSCGSGPSSPNFAISVSAAVGAAGTITGSSQVCKGGAATYSVAPVSGAVSYTWTYTGTGFTASGNTSTITGTFSSTATSGNLTVKGVNGCGVTGSSSPNFAVTADVCPPHNSCNQCHINHTAPGAQLTMVGGNANLCMSCHNPSGVASTSPFQDVMRAIPGTSGTSHSWNALAVNAQYQTTLPTDPNMLNRIYSNQIVCSTCHNQHNNTYTPFLRRSNAEDSLCLKCHSPRDIRQYAVNPANRGSHPVGIVYPSGTDPRFQATTLPLSSTGKVNCSTCHKTHYSVSTDGNILRTSTIDSTCINCHIAVSQNRKTTHEGLSCSVCHYAHETGSNNILLVRSSIVTPSLGTKTVVFTGNSSATNYGDGTAPFDGICEICHTTAVDHYQASSGGISDPRHFPAPQKCTACHPHDKGFAAQTDCFACHNAVTDKTGVGPPGGRRQIVDNLGNGSGTGGDYKRTSHHNLGSIPTVQDCLLCHYMGDHKKGTVKLLDPDQGYLNVITYDPANKSSIESFCLKCHDADGVAGDLTPFSDNTTVPLIDNTMWQASAHKTKPYTCLDCHDNGHGSNKSALLGPYNYSGPGTGTDLMNEEEGFCLTCHGSGGAATVKVHLAFGYTNTATRYFEHDPNATYRKHVNGETGGAVFSGTNRHVECVDCHNPHGAKAGTATAPTLPPTLTGAKGVEPIYSGAGAPTGFTWIASVTQEYQVCFKCHSSYTSLPTYLPDGISNATPTYVTDGLKKLTTGGSNLQIADSRDMAREFNPNNQSFHPVMAAGKNTGIQSTAFQTGYSSTSRIYCTSCHNNPNWATAGQGRGPHGSANLHILDKGINATVGNYITSHGSVSNQNEVCSKCHNVGSYYTGNTGSRFGFHQYHTTKAECYVCHDTHGSETFHLMNFNRNNGGGSTCISAVTTNTQAAFGHANGTATNSCGVTCHGVLHSTSTKTYNPSY